MAATADTDTLDTRELLRVLSAARKGDFSVRMPEDNTGVAGKIADTLNGIIELNQRLAGELQRVGSAVGEEGKVNQRVSLGDVQGSWVGCVHSVNSLIEGLVQPTTEVGRVIGAVAKGDLS